MNRLELPAPPAPHPPFFPIPPAPRTTLPAHPTNPVTRRPARALVSVAIGLVLVLIIGIGAVIASHPSKGDPRPLFGGERSHAFIGRSAEGEPFRWDPCSTIHYQVDRGQMDDRVLDDVKEAVRRISQASGLAFEFDGFVHASVNDPHACSVTFSSASTVRRPVRDPLDAVAVLQLCVTSATRPFHGTSVVYV